MLPATKEALLIAVKTIAMTCTMPRVKIEYLTAELVVAVTRTIRRCLWGSATVAKARGVQEIQLADVKEAVAKYAGLSQLRCNQSDHIQAGSRFQMKMQVLCRYVTRLVPKGWKVHLLAHKFMAIRLGYMVALLVTEVMVGKAKTGAGLNETTAAAILSTAAHRSSMGWGTPEPEVKEPVDMETEEEVVEVPVEGQCSKTPSSQDVAEEHVLRQIYMDGDCDPVEDANFAEMKAEASELLDVGSPRKYHVLTIGVQAQGFMVDWDEGEGETSQGASVEVMEGDRVVKRTNGCGFGLFESGCKKGRAAGQ